MLIPRQKLPAQLAQPLPALITLAGDEPLLVQEHLDAVRAAARQQGYSERMSFSVEPGFSWQALLDECNSMSLFASLRLIEVHLPKGPNGHRRGKGEDSSDSDAGSSEDGLKALAALIARPPQDVCLLVVCGALEKQGRELKWYAQLEASGLCCYAAALSAAELPPFIRERAKALNLLLSDEAVTELAERTEGNLLACQQDLAKLALLHPGVTLSGEMLAQAVADSARFEAFDLVDKMLRGQPEAAVHALARLREEGVHALELVGALGYTLRAWATAGATYAKTRDPSTALAQAKIFGSRRTAYELALKGQRGFNPNHGLVRLANVDQCVKSGREAYAWEELLTLVLAASGASPPPVSRV